MSSNGRSEEASWCFFRGDPNIRSAIKFRLEESGLSQRELSLEVGVAPYRFSKYLNKRIPNLNQYQLYAICERLGIKVRLNVEFGEIPQS